MSLSCVRILYYEKVSDENVNDTPQRAHVKRDAAVVPVIRYLETRVGRTPYTRVYYAVETIILFYYFSLFYRR